VLDVLLLQLLDFGRIEHYCAVGCFGAEVAAASVFIVGISGEESFGAGKLPILLRGVSHHL
jgi:hypothetical protein